MLYNIALSTQSDTDDYNTFDNSHKKQKKSNNRRRTSSNRRSSQHTQSGFPLKMLFTACIAVVALILLIVIVVAIFSAPSKGIKLEDNVFAVYADSDGKYHAVSNGKAVKYDFEGELQIQPAMDNSFAYIFEEVTKDDGPTTQMYILKGSKIEKVKATADDILCFAAFEPGIVFKQGNSVQYYSLHDEGQIVSNSTADNFLISGDATTVVYTIEDTKTGLNQLRYFRNAVSSKISLDSDMRVNCTPVALSNDGKYVYSSYVSAEIDEDTEEEVSTLSVLGYTKVEKDGDKYSDHTFITSAANGSFEYITGMNLDGNEIVFYTSSAKGNVSFFYDLESGSTKKPAKPVQIADGIFAPLYAGKEIVCAETLLDTYFTCEKIVIPEAVEDEDEEDAPADGEVVISTYLLDKKDETPRKLSDTIGEFSDDGKYFYFIDTNDENSLMRIPLSSKDFAKDKQNILADVVSFSLTEKGDIYALCLDGSVDEGTIYFKSSSRTKIANRVDIDSVYTHKDSIYFSVTEDEIATIYVSTGGSAMEEITFKTAPTEMPTLVMGSGEKGYAYFTDENGNTSLYYTSNGKKFSVVATTCTIPDADLDD